MKRITKHLVLIFCSLLTLSTFTNAQNQDFEKIYTFNNYDDAYRICQTSDNSFWVGGATSNGTDFLDGKDLLLKLDADGNKIWHKTYVKGLINLIEPCKNNGVLINFWGNGFEKLDNNGNTLWKKSLTDVTSFKEVANENVAVTYNNTLYLYDKNGVALWNKPLGTSSEKDATIQFSDATNILVTLSASNTEFNEFIFDYSGNLVKNTLISKKGNAGPPIKTKDAYILFELASSVTNTMDIWKIRNDSVIWKTTYQVTAPNTGFLSKNQLIDKDDNLVVAITEFLPGAPNENAAPLIMVWDKNGKFKSVQTFKDSYYNDFSGLCETNDGAYAACGSFNLIQDCCAWKSKIRVVKTKGNKIQNVLKGKIFADSNNNCSKENTEKTLENTILKAVNNTNDVFYTMTDAAGNYQLFFSGDSLKLMVASPSPYLKQSCAATLYKSPNQSIYEKDIPVQVISDCAHLAVDMGSYAFRPCFDTKVSVSYKNFGFTASPASYIDVTLDPNLTYQSSSITAVSQGNNIYRFMLGNVAAQASGSFSITASVKCDNSLLNSTLCNTAHIYPDSLCAPIALGKITTNGTCNGTKIQFNIKNESNSPMPSARNFYVIEDDVMYMQGNFNLNPNETKTISVDAAQGKTYRLMAEQTNIVYGKFVCTAFQNCNFSNTPSIDFFNQFPQGDDTPFEDIDCRLATSSYDPNDKQAVPRGIKSEHIIAKNTDLDYTIRFQNKGTDTAFTVIIRDTLSQYLDPATIQAGASSHAYRMDLTGNGIVSFTFNNINLPHQKVNDEGSNGFVKFRIKQRLDVPNGTVIKNKASIYFDFNAPIVTNETFHTIGENWITIIPVSTKDMSYENVVLKIYPNPFAQQSTIEVEGDYNDLIFKVYDLSGRSVRQEKFDGNRLDFVRNGLTSGLYIYEVASAGKTIQQGKIVVE